MAERIHTLFHKQNITITSVLTTLSMTISTIALAITGVFGGGGSPSKNKGALNNWLNRLADVLERLSGKAAELLPTIVLLVLF